MSDIVERLRTSNTAYAWMNRQNIEAADEIQSLRQQLADTQRKLEAAEKRNEGRDLYAWRYARLSEKNNTQEVGVPYVVALNKQGELEHLYFGALGQTCDIAWPMPDRAIEQSNGGDDGN